MQTRKKPLTIMLSLIATLTLLFGGWYMYQKMEIEEPIRQTVEAMKSAQLSNLHIDKNEVAIELTVTHPEMFPNEYKELSNSMAQMLDNKDVNITVSNKDSDLQTIWADGVFAFTEAVDLHQYSKVPALLSQWKQEHQLDVVDTQMDERNVYVFMKRGKDAFYVMVPRFPNEQEVQVNG